MIRNLFGVSEGLGEVDAALDRWFSYVTEGLSWMVPIAEHSRSVLMLRVSRFWRARDRHGLECLSS